MYYMDRKRRAQSNLQSLAILAILLVSLFTHYAVDALPPATQVSIPSIQGSGYHVTSVDAGTPNAHFVHVVYMETGAVLLGMLISLTYTLLSLACYHENKILPPPIRPPIILPYFS